MKDPFTEIDEAFAPMFQEDVVFSLKSNQRQTVKVFVSTSQSAEPLVDDVIDTEMEEILVVANRKDWKLLDKVERGDTMERNVCGKFPKTYSVMDVQFDEAMGVIIRARARS